MITAGRKKPDKIELMDNSLLFSLVTLCIGSALTTLISFILYLKARTAERDHPDEMGPGHQHRHAKLDRKERLFKSIHLKSLFIFVVLGVLILIIISRRID
jgi:hypothetical protein